MAQVLGLDVGEVRAGVRSWAWRQHAAGELDDVGHTDVVALVDDARDGAR